MRGRWHQDTAVVVEEDGHDPRELRVLGDGADPPERPPAQDLRRQIVQAKRWHRLTWDEPRKSRREPPYRSILERQGPHTWLCDVTPREHCAAHLRAVWPPEMVDIAVALGLSSERGDVGRRHALDPVRQG